MPDFALLIGLLSFIIGIGGFIFWLWMLIDCLKNKSFEGNEKLIWILVIIFVNLLGAIIYFFAGRKK